MMALTLLSSSDGFAISLVSGLYIIIPTSALIFQQNDIKFTITRPSGAMPFLRRIQDRGGGERTSRNRRLGGAAGGGTKLSAGPQLVPLAQNLFRSPPPPGSARALMGRNGSRLKQRLKLKQIERNDSTQNV